MKRATLRALEDLGLRINDRDITVLKAIIKASGGKSRPASYAEISKVHAAISKREFSKAWMYRCLNSLRNRGLIGEDAVQHPKQYFVRRNHIESLLGDLMETRMKELTSTKANLQEKIGSLNNARTQDLAIRVYDKMVGNRRPTTSLVVEGTENVRHTVIREFGEAAEKGDTVRLLSFISLLDGGLSTSGPTEQELVAAVHRGARVMGLMIPWTKDKSGTDLIAEFVRNMVDQFNKTSATGSILLRVSKEIVNTYRMVSLNREKMILYLTNAAESDAAALIQRKDNPGLVDDAVDTFDRLFADGIDVLDAVRGCLHQNSAS